MWSNSCCLSKENYTAELKQQLTEKDNELEELKNKLDASIAFEMTYYNDLQKAKKQLAEKDKEIEELKIKFAEKSTGLPREGVIQVDICYRDACIQSKLSQYKLYHKDKLSGITIKIEDNNIRHQVCEELRNNLTSRANSLGFQNRYAEFMYDLEDLIDIIDWIEGESK